MISRVIWAILVGVVAWLLAVIVLAIVSAILPGLEIDASFWGGVFGLLMGLLALFGNVPRNIFR